MVQYDKWRGKNHFMRVIICQPLWRSNSDLVLSERAVGSRRDSAIIMATGSWLEGESEDRYGNAWLTRESPNSKSHLSDWHSCQLCSHMADDITQWGGLKVRVVAHTHTRTQPWKSFPSLRMWSYQCPGGRTVWLAPLCKHKLLFINSVINTGRAVISKSILAWRVRIIYIFFFSSEKLIEKAHSGSVITGVPCWASGQRWDMTDRKRRDLMNSMRLFNRQVPDCSFFLFIRISGISRYQPLR